MSMTAKTSGTEAAAAKALAPRVFRLPLSVRLGSLIGAIILFATTAIMFAFVALGFTVNWGFGLFILGGAGLMAALTVYVLRDLNGKLGLRIVLDADAVTLALPSGRSLIHRPPAQHITVPYADIQAMETRLEAYGSLRMAIMQRVYVLHRKSGELVFLFEERALATAMASSMFGDIATDLAKRAGLELNDLGMAEGQGGLLCVWGARAPDWAAPALSPQRQRQLWARASVTGAAAAVAVSSVPGVWLGGMRRRRLGSEPPPSQS
jgi:hypothetical protein